MGECDDVIDGGASEGGHKRALTVSSTNDDNDDVRSL